MISCNYIRVTNILSYIVQAKLGFLIYNLLIESNGTFYWHIQVNIETKSTQSE